MRRSAPAVPPRWLALGAIFLLAALVRFWGIGFGLPHTQARPDETQIIEPVRTLLSGHSPNFFDYPWLYLWVSAALDYGYFLVGLAAGWFHSLSGFLADWPHHWEPWFLINRALSATLGSLTVLAVFGTARRLWDERTALIAAFFMAFAFIHVRDSHFGTTDATMTFFIVMSTSWLIDGHTTGSRRSFVLAGVMGGLATATKYNAGVIMFPVLVSQIVQVVESRRSGEKPAFDGRMFWFGIPCAAAFFIGVPFLVFDYERFRAAMTLLSESMQVGTGGVTASLGNGWLHHLRFSLFYGVGWPLLIVSAAAAVKLLYKRTGIALVLLTFPTVYFFVIGSVRNLFFRYAIPIVPFVCLLAAWAVVAAASRLMRGRDLRAVTFATWALAFIVIIPSAMSVFRFDRLAATTDNRVVVSRWFDDHVPAGASIAQSGSGYGYAQFTPGRFNPWVWEGNRFVTIDFLTRARRPAIGKPDYILIQESPLPNTTQDEIKTLLSQGYLQVTMFRALKLDEPRVYDMQDAFFIPFSDFGGVDRPGPNFTLYKYVGQ